MTLAIHDSSGSVVELASCTVAGMSILGLGFTCELPFTCNNSDGLSTLPAASHCVLIAPTLSKALGQPIDLCADSITASNDLVMGLAPFGPVRVVLSKGCSICRGRSIRRSRIRSNRHTILVIFLTISEIVGRNEGS